MLPYHVALISYDVDIPLDALTDVAAALQKQVLRDFGPLWGIQADVTAFASLDRVPLDYWRVMIVRDISDPGVAGYHETEHGQPFSLVEYGDSWTLTASHEVLEMLGDPYGRRLVAGDSPIEGQGRVLFLVEVCDPSEAPAYSYAVNGVRVSDFYTPHYFDPVGSTGARYSFVDAIKAPREVLPGGYLCWYDPETRNWWRRDWFGDALVDQKLGRMKIKGGNLRMAIDRLSAPHRLPVMRDASALTAAHGSGIGSTAASAAHGADLHAQIERILAPA